MANDVTKLIMETTLGLITTAFALVAALAWNGAIEKLIGLFFTNPNDLTGVFVYAIVVTIIAVIVTVLLARFAAKMGIELDD